MISRLMRKAFLRLANLSREFDQVKQVGSFASPILTIDTVHLSGSANTSDIFLAKFNPAGDLQWVKQIGGANDDDAVAIACNSSGEIFIAGVSYSSTIQFDTLSVTIKRFSGSIGMIKKVARTAHPRYIKQIFVPLVSY